VPEGAILGRTNRVVLKKELAASAAAVKRHTKCRVPIEIRQPSTATAVVLAATVGWFKMAP